MQTPQLAFILLVPLILSFLHHCPHSEFHYFSISCLDAKDHLCPHPWSLSSPYIAIIITLCIVVLSLSIPHFFVCFGGGVAYETLFPLLFPLLSCTQLIWFGWSWFYFMIPKWSCDPSTANNDIRCFLPWK